MPKKAEVFQEESVETKNETQTKQKPSLEGVFSELSTVVPDRFLTILKNANSGKRKPEDIVDSLNDIITKDEKISATLRLSWKKAKKGIAAVKIVDALKTSGTKGNNAKAKIVYISGTKASHVEAVIHNSVNTSVSTNDIADVPSVVVSSAADAGLEDARQLAEAGQIVPLDNNTVQAREEQRENHVIDQEIAVLEEERLVNEVLDKLEGKENKETKELTQEEIRKNRLVGLFKAYTTSRSDFKYSNFILGAEKIGLSPQDAVKQLYGHYNKPFFEPEPSVMLLSGKTRLEKQDLFIKKMLRLLEQEEGAEHGEGGIINLEEKDTGKDKELNDLAKEYVQQLTELKQNIQQAHTSKDDNDLARLGQRLLEWRRQIEGDGNFGKDLEIPENRQAENLRKAFYDAVVVYRNKGEPTWEEMEKTEERVGNTLYGYLQEMEDLLRKRLPQSKFAHSLIAIAEKNNDFLLARNLRRISPGTIMVLAEDMTGYEAEEADAAVAVSSVPVLDSAPQDAAPFSHAIQDVVWAEHWDMPKAETPIKEELEKIKSVYDSASWIIDEQIALLRKNSDGELSQEYNYLEQELLNIHFPSKDDYKDIPHTDKREKVIFPAIESMRGHYRSKLWERDLLLGRIAQGKQVVEQEAQNFANSKVVTDTGGGLYGEAENESSVPAQEKKASGKITPANAGLAAGDQNSPEEAGVLSNEKIESVENHPAMQAAKAAAEQSIREQFFGEGPLSQDQEKDLASMVEIFWKYEKHKLIEELKADNILM
jgi:hypothetical protein